MAYTEDLLKDLKKHLIRLVLNLQNKRDKFIKIFAECMPNLS